MLLAVAAVCVCAILFRAELYRGYVSLTQSIHGKKTVAERVAQYGPVVRSRLDADFQRVQVPYPPAKVTFLGLKLEKLLEVWVAPEGGRFRLLRTYPILGASGTMGPKLREGDLQVPEGLYRIESLNPNSMFHLALRVDYPNDFDVEQARRDGRTNLGGDIMIHGSAGSVGCLAMGDEAAEDLFVLAAETGIENISVILSPVDFRVRSLPGDVAGPPSWAPVLYERIRAAMQELQGP
jgi:murein L,D-transpeptidase YafK